MNVHLCDGCGTTAQTQTVLPPAGWVRRGGRRLHGVGRWLLVLCAECDGRAGAGGAGRRDRI